MPDILNTLKANLNQWNPQVQPAQAGSVPHLFLTVAGMSAVVAQISTAQKLSGAEPLADDVDVLQIFVEMPFKMDVSAFAETAKLISVINAKLPTIGFIANPTNGQVAVRYMHLINPNEPNFTLLNEALSNIDVIIDIYADEIKPVATGNRTFEEAIDSLP